MTSQFLNKTGKKITLITFVIGFLIFIMYYLTANENLVFAGLIYILVAGLFNLILLILVLVKAFKRRQDRRSLLNTAGFILLNIPVVFLFLWFGVVLLNTMRVTIINSTTEDISDIVLEGCEKAEISVIKAGQSKNVWIEITGECGIFMKYRQGKNNKKEVVVDYTYRLRGGKVIHKVGTKDITNI